MASFDYDVVIIGSGFGGSVAALRAAEKGYRVGVMESGRRWKDEDIPKTQWDLPHFLWMPVAELYGIHVGVLLPGVWRTIGGVLPPGASVDLARSVLFFDGARVVGPILVLVVWAALGTALALALGGRIMNPADIEAAAAAGAAV